MDAIASKEIRDFPKGQSRQLKKERARNLNLKINLGEGIHGERFTLADRPVTSLPAMVSMLLLHKVHFLLLHKDVIPLTQLLHLCLSSLY
jgi:hypothetical protein